MKVFNTIFVGLLGAVIGCEKPTVPPQPLTFSAGTAAPSDSGSVETDGANSGWIESTQIDDGFGTSIAYGDREIWIGAPFGDMGTVYRWIGTGLDTVLTGSGKLGSHLAWTTEGLWIAAPLTNGGEGAILLADGTVRFAEQRATGIALTGSGSGAFAWESGWTVADGETGASRGRPSSLSIDAHGNVGVGMARGPECFSVKEQTIPRPAQSDEAGFSLASADINQDAVPDWIVGAPGANKILVFDGNTLEIIRSWAGTGRFGHAVAVCKDHNGIRQLVVGSPLAEETGTVSVFSNFAVEASAIWTGRQNGGQLGTSVGCMPDGFLAGAPGFTDGPAAVLWARFGS